MRQLQPAHDQHWFDLYGQVAKTGQSMHTQQWATHLTGGVWYAVFAFPFGEAQNHQVAILFNDITQQRADVERLSYSKERLQLPLEAMDLAVYEWDLINNRLTANDRFRQLLGIGPDEVILGALSWSTLFTRTTARTSIPL